MTDYTRKRGDTYADEYTIKRASTKQPLDLTGYTFLMTVSSTKAPTDNTTQLYQLTGTIVDAPAGRVEFAPSESQANVVGTYYFDVEMRDPAGRKRTIDEGKYVYTQDITK